MAHARRLLRFGWHGADMAAYIESVTMQAVLAIVWGRCTALMGSTSLSFLQSVFFPGFSGFMLP